MDFKNCQFFGKVTSLSEKVNKDSVRNVSILSIGTISVVWSFLYILFLFLAGIGKIIPVAFIQAENVRNMSIAIVHSFSSAFAIVFSTFFLDKEQFDGRIISPAYATIAVYGLTFFLAWTCYFTKELDILIFVTTLDGMMLSIFLFFLASLQYDVINPKTSRRSNASITLRSVIIIAFIVFFSALLVYYDYLSSLLTVTFHLSLSAFQTDALVLFMYLVGILLLITAFVTMFILEYYINSWVKHRSKKANGNRHGEHHHHHHDSNDASVQ